MVTPGVCQCAAPQLALALAAPLPGGAGVVCHRVPGEGEDTGGASPRPRHGTARVTRVRALAPGSDVSNVRPRAVSGGGAPLPVIQTLVLRTLFVNILSDYTDVTLPQPSLNKFNNLKSPKGTVGPTKKSHIYRPIGSKVKDT